MHAQHPTFKLPPNMDGKIWQYMELAEFVSMLHRKALFFVKANKLRDPYEGIMPQFNNSIRSPGYSKENQQSHSQEQSSRYIQKLPQITIQQFQLYRELVLINPWHYNEYESAAMWNLYSHENAGIAIQSTTRKLSKCFNDNKEDTIWIGKVQYLDFPKDWTTEWNNNLFQAFVTKRKSFEYENEIRAVTCLPDDNLSTDSVVKTANREDLFFSSSPKDRVINPKDLTDKGKYVSADLQTLIEKVYIAPYAEPWFEEVLESLLSKYELNTTTVTKSDLYTIS
jgi:hypothetical protein